MTINRRQAPARRRPRAIEFSLLYGWHALLSGAFIVAYLSSDEDTFAMHQFAGYTVLAALALRVIVGVFVAEGSPLRLPRPTLTPIREWVDGALHGRSQPLPRRPLLSLAAVVLLMFVGAAAGSGAIADFVPPIEHLHEAIGELAPWFVLGHVAMVVALYWRQTRRAPGGSTRARPSALGRPKTGAGTAAMLAAVLLCLSEVAVAGEPARDAILDKYARQAKAETPDFAGFSAARGEALYRGPHAGEIRRRQLARRAIRRIRACRVATSNPVDRSSRWPSLSIPADSPTPPTSKSASVATVRTSSADPVPHRKKGISSPSSADADEDEKPHSR